MVVLEGDAKLHGLLLERSGRRRWLERDLLPTPEAMAFRAGVPIDQDCALGHEPLGRGAGAHLLEAGQEAVETLSGGFGRNADADQERTASPAARRRGRRSAAARAIIRSATPTTMKVSARLKAGQKRRSRKSVTWPSRTRSRRFEMLPPIRSPSAAGSTGWREPERAK